jgi:outer membrane PBP1 activator LpoA protein
MIFVDAPWLVGAASGVPKELTHSAINQHWQQLMKGHSRLIALGIDAYRLVPYLQVMKQNPDERLDGLTGELHLGDNQTINRGLVSARFVNGKPVFEMPTKEGPTNEEIATSEHPAQDPAKQDS